MMDAIHLAAVKDVMDTGIIDWTHLFYVGSITLTLVGDVLIPILFFRFERGERQRQEMHRENQNQRREDFTRVHERMDHLDRCFDSMRDKVLSGTASRAEFAEFRVDTEKTLTRMSESMTASASALAQRIYRLEDRLFERNV